MPLKLSDKSISQIAKCLQVAILSGTDVIDHLRQIEFENENNTLNITPEYEALFDKNIQKMIKEAQEAQPENSDGSTTYSQMSLF